MPLCKDFNFKGFFKSEENRPLLIALLNDFLPLPLDSKIVQAYVLDSELLPKDDFRKRGVLDIRARTERLLPGGGTRVESVNVEMQTTSKPSLARRLVFYASGLYWEQLKKGQDFDQQGNVYSLTFTTFDMPQFKGLAEYVHHCDLRSRKAPYAPLTSAMNFIIVELSKFHCVLGQLLDSQENWCYLLKNSGQMTEEEARALSLRGETMSRTVRGLWHYSRSDLLEEIEEVEQMRRQEEREQMRKEVQEEVQKEVQKEMQEQKQKAAQKGHREGMEKGEQKRAREIACDMLASGAEPQLVAKITKLTLAEVKKLK